MSTTSVNAADAPAAPAAAAAAARSMKLAHMKKCAAEELARCNYGKAADR
jgi:hypothetical protein